MRGGTRYGGYTGVVLTISYDPYFGKLVTSTILNHGKRKIYERPENSHIEPLLRHSGYFHLCRHPSFKGWQSL